MTHRAADLDFDRPAAKGGTGCDPEAAASSLVWGIAAILTCWLPLLNPVFPLAGLVRGWSGRKAWNRDQARTGIFLSSIALGLGGAALACLIHAVSLLRDF